MRSVVRVRHSLTITVRVPAEWRSGGVRMRQSLSSPEKVSDWSERVSE